MSSEFRFAVEYVPIDDLRPDPTSPRRIEERREDALTKVIRDFDLVQPVVARRADRMVIAGHQRLAAARRLGHTVVPVVFLDLSVERGRLLGLALNNAYGTWDEPLLARLLADLNAMPDIDVTLSGFDGAEVQAYLRRLEVAEKRERPESFDFDAAFAEATREPRAKTGDLWLLGEHRLLCGDATAADHLIKIIGDAPADMAFTDPPYNVDLGNHGGPSTAAHAAGRWP